MKVGFFRRAFSWLIDFSIIFGTLALVFNIFVSSIIMNGIDNYEEHKEKYNANVEIYNTDVDVLDLQLKNEEITQTEYEALFEVILDDFNTENQEYATTLLSYFIKTIIFFLISYAIMNYVYNLILRGQTIGRRMSKIRLEGHITWYSLLMRELFYKTILWYTVVGFVIDMGLIIFSKSKKSIRDHVSGTYIIYEGVQYPF
jgi:uncharacterized RDD family membrane protein YckC